MKQKKDYCNKAIKKIKVYQLENKNQFLIDTDNYRFFQSYNSLIACYEKSTHVLTLGCDWNYSNTTRKHLYIFIKDYCYLPEIDDALYNTNNKKATIFKLIENGVIKYNKEMQ